VGLYKSFGQTPIDDFHWDIIFDEEFDYTDYNDFISNQSFWDIANNDDKGWDGSAIQVYTNRNNNINIDFPEAPNNGNLVLQAVNEPYSCPPDYVSIWHCNTQYYTGQPYNYTSAWIETKEGLDTQYGYIESRIKLPYGYGFWPAFWTFMGHIPSEDASNAAEIDIFEMLGHEPSTTMGTNMHLNYCPTNEPQNGCSTYPSYSEYICDGVPCFGQDVTINSYEDTYHIYAIEWTPTKIIWYVDGKVVRNYFNPGIVDPVRIILNFAMDYGYRPNSSTPFPADIYIDYVRVYQGIKDCDNLINSCEFDFSANENIIENAIIIGEGGCSNSIPEGTDVNLRASQFIEIKGDFYVPLGSSLYADANNECPSDLSIECTNIFNPCYYDFANYDNTTKKLIQLAGNGCTIAINPTMNHDILLQATDRIEVKSRTTINAVSGNDVKLRIASCQ